MALRGHLRLSVDDLLVVAKEFLHPDLPDGSVSTAVSAGSAECAVAIEYTRDSITPIRPSIHLGRLPAYAVRSTLVRGIMSLLMPTFGGPEQAAQQWVRESSFGGYCIEDFCNAGKTVGLY